MSKNSPCQGAHVLMGKHKQKKLVKPLLVMVSAKKKRQGKGIGSEDVCVCWWCGRVAISFPMLGKFSTINSSNIFSGPFSLSSFWDPYNVNVVAFNLVPEVS